MEEVLKLRIEIDAIVDRNNPPRVCTVMLSHELLHPADDTNHRYLDFDFDVHQDEEGGSNSISVAAPI